MHPNFNLQELFRPMCQAHQLRSLIPPVHLHCQSTILIVVLALFILSPHAQAQLYKSSVVGTEFDFITEADPSTFSRIEFAELGRAEMPDKRDDDLPLFREAFKFRAHFSDSHVVDIYVDADFENRQTAKSEAMRYVDPLGKLPPMLRKGVSRLVVHRGGPNTTAFSDTGLIVVYSENATRRIGTHDLEETIFHESIHAAWDAKYAESPRWQRAQAADGAFATHYAKRLPNREDLAESALFAFTLLTHPERIPKADRLRIRSTIPNRIAFVGQLLKPVDETTPLPKGDNADQQNNADRPNILLILTDDQGWPTLGCYGGTRVATPHLDRLAAEGVRLTDAYVMPQCTPTRAALLTGQHTSRSGMWHVIGWYGTPWAPVAEPMFREQLAPAQCRLPRLLHQAGYRTGMAGKWHLTNNEHGFYTYLREESGRVFGFDYVAPPGVGSQNEGDKWVDHLTDAACQFMTNSKDQPWFFYLSHHTLHNKVAAPEHLVRRHLDNGAPASGHFNATYLAAIEHLDTSIGRLLGTLESSGQAENTLVVFMADNGGIDTSYNLPQWDQAPLDGSKPLTMKEQQYDNAPLRAGKGSVYEGGIRVPAIIRWPQKISAGQVNSMPVHVVDWLPTFTSAAMLDEQTITSAGDCAVDGMNLLPLLNSANVPTEERSLYWYMPLYDLRWASTPAAVIRKGKWKLIHYFGDWYDAQQNYHIGRRSELYDLSNDLGETLDLASSHPETASAMRGELLDWIKTTGAPIPQPNSSHDPSRRLEETKEKQQWLGTYPGNTQNSSPE